MKGLVRLRSFIVTDVCKAETGTVLRRSSDREPMH